jgi:hypothetical protein
LVKYPITAVIGNRGSGKTCFLTFLADQYHKEGKKIFTNFELKGIPHEKMNLGIMATLPDKLSNAVVLMDELHMGADSYDFMKKSSRAFNTFATQLRKRKVNWYFTTQIFTQVARRIRLQTDFMITMENTKKENIFKCTIYDRRGSEPREPINSFNFNGAPYFDKYDTDEVILFEEPEDDELEN